MIIVSADDQETAIPFNLKIFGAVNSKQPDILMGQQSMQLYLVDAAGCIDFPILGKLKVGGLTRTEVLNVFQEKYQNILRNQL